MVQAPRPARAPDTRRGVLTALPIGRWWAGALLAGLTLAAYLPALRAGFVWDDDTFLTQNPLIKAADGLRRFWATAEATDYWPVTSTTLWVEWRLWGMHAAGYHATNLLLHIAECLLLWRIFSLLRIPGAYLAALIFAVHPVNVESVAWIAQRKNLLAMLFFLASIFCFVKNETASPAPAGGNVGEGGRKWFWLSLASFILALLSKGSVAMLRRLAKLSTQDGKPASTGRRRGRNARVVAGLAAAVPPRDRSCRSQPWRAASHYPLDRRADAPNQLR